MPTPIASATFTGISSDAIRGVSFTRSRGVAPDVAILYVEPQTSLAATTGTLALTYDGSTRSWTGMVVDSQYMQDVPVRDNPQQVIAILDRRSQWSKGYVEIHANMRDDAGAVITASKLEPSAIATKCLDAMGETGYSVAGMATGMYPLVDYKGRADLLLQQLCQDTGHIVVPSGDNFDVVKYGDGSDLPGSGQIVTEYEITSASVPASITMVGGATRYQSKIRLEAVGYDTDGSLKLIDSLSFKPASGWEEQSPYNFLKITAADRPLAFRDVFRLFRVKEQWAGGLIVSGGSATPSSISQYLPLVDAVATGGPAYVEGVYWSSRLQFVNVPTDSRISVGFLVDGDTIRFPRPIFKCASNKVEKPDLGLVIQHHLLIGDNYDAFTRSGASLGGAGEVLKLLRPEMILVKVNYPSASSNLTALNTEADAYLASHALRFADMDVKQVQYEGVAAIDPTGLVAQVKYTVNLGEVTYTEASRIREFDIYSGSELLRQRNVWVDGQRGV